MLDVMAVQVESLSVEASMVVVVEVVVEVVNVMARTAVTRRETRPSALPETSLSPFVQTERFCRPGNQGEIL